MLRIAICEDDTIMSERLCSEVDRYLHSLAYKVTCFCSGKSIIDEIEDGYYADILLLDIELPDQSGLSIAEYLNLHKMSTRIIIVSQYFQYVFEGYKVGAFRYIPKSKLEDEFEEALLSAVKLVGKAENRFVLLNNQQQCARIYYNDILYITYENRKCIFILSGGDTISCRGSLIEINDQLCSEQFVNIERGYIINLCHVKRVEGFFAVMENGDRLPIPQRKKKIFLSALKQYWIREEI